MVAILDKYSYHGYVDTRDSLVFDEKWQAELSRVGACCLFMGIEPNDNRRHHIKQSDVNSIRMIYAVPLFNLTENRGRQGNRK